MAALYFGRKIPPKRREERCLELLERVGLKDRIHHRPDQLSGGEQQRVCIARALANDPELLLADEPTANLDPDNRAQVMELLQEMVAEKGITLVAATHDGDFLKSLQYTIQIGKAGEERKR